MSGIQKCDRKSSQESSYESEPKVCFYQGSCHCGNLRFKVQCEDTLTEVSECGCSYCRMTGMQTMTDLCVKMIEPHSEWTQYTDYTFGAKERAHRFCSLCGSCVATISQGQLATVNVRMMYDDFPPKSLAVHVHGESSMQEGHQSIPVKHPETIRDGRWRYFGSCHCRAVIYEIESPKVTSANECTCTICWRNAYLWLYPLKPDLKLLSGEESLKKYQFGSKSAGHMFCKTCGVKPFNFLSDANAPICPINVRTLEVVDLATLKHKPQDVEITLPDGSVVRQSIGDGREM